MNGGTPSIIRGAAPAVVPDGSISRGEPIEFPSGGDIAHAFWYPPKNRDYKGPPANCPSRRSVAWRPDQHDDQ